MLMVSEPWARSSMFAAGLLWPPDDVEESVARSDLHQKTITNLRLGIYEPWLPEPNGRWRSGEIAVSIGLEGVQATVYDAAGRPQLREGQIGRELARRDAELAELRRLVEELRGT